MFKQDKEPIIKIWNWRHPIRSLKRSIHRIKYGWCDIDIWNLDHYLASVISSTLIELANTAHGYPGTDKFDTPEKWENALKIHAYLLRRASDWENWPNPHRDEYMNSISFKNDGNRVLIISDEVLRDKYFKQEQINFDEAKSSIGKVFTFIGDNYYSLWD